MQTGVASEDAMVAVGIDLHVELFAKLYDLKQQMLVYRFRSGHDARFRLVVGAEAAGVPASLAGVALRRVEAPAVPGK